jgi:hypothetical protein
MDTETWKQGDIDMTWKHEEMETLIWIHGDMEFEKSNRKRKPRQFS